MDERIIMNILDNSNDLSYGSYNENDSDSQDSSKDEDQTLPTSNNSQSEWNTVTGTN